MANNDELKKGLIVPFLTSCFEQFGRISVVRGRPAGTILVEVYVLIWLGIELLLLSLLLAFPSWSSNNGFIILVPIVFCYRVLDMLRAAYFWLIISPFRGGKKWQIISTPRLLFLSCINFIELWIIFGVFCFLARDGFSPSFNSAWNSFYYSLNVISTFGTNVEPVSVLSKILFVSQIVIGLSFIIVIISRAISLLPYNRNDAE